jgi:oligopeptide/dipeptide ABC transporter ATP-binding protein
MGEGWPKAGVRSFDLIPLFPPSPPGRRGICSLLIPKYMEMNSTESLLSVSGLKTYFPVSGKGVFAERQFVRAVDGVEFCIQRAKTLGLVGESGSGKTTVGRTILRLTPSYEGKVIFDGQDVFALTGKEMRGLRRRMQIIFQDPMSSLNPRMTIQGCISEPLIVHSLLSRAQRKQRVGELLERVGLSAHYMSRYPHEFSGGQRQRIGIARALASNPDFIVCDEPVSALDVSIQAQILNLLSDLQRDMGLSFLFIAHNLAVVEHFADEVAVMYLGRIVEKADRDSLYANPTHPYTQALLSAIPVPDPTRKKDHVPLPGETPSPISPPKGCPFHPRCEYTRKIATSLAKSETVEISAGAEKAMVVSRCTQEIPSLKPIVGNPGHCHACLLKQ